MDVLNLDSKFRPLQKLLERFEEGVTGIDEQRRRRDWKETLALPFSFFLDIEPDFTILESSEESCASSKVRERE